MSNLQYIASETAHGGALPHDTALWDRAAGGEWIGDASITCTILRRDVVYGGAEPRVGKVGGGTVGHTNHREIDTRETPSGKII